MLLNLNAALRILPGRHIVFSIYMQHSPFNISNWISYQLTAMQENYRVRLLILRYVLLHCFLSTGNIPHSFLTSFEFLKLKSVEIPVKLFRTIAESTFVVRKCKRYNEIQYWMVYIETRLLIYAHWHSRILFHSSRLKLVWDIILIELCPLVQV